MHTRPLSYSSKEFGFHVGGFFLSGASDVGDPKDENWAGVSRRGEGGRKKESFSTPFLAHPPIWKQFAFSCCLAHKRRNRGRGKQKKKNLHLRIICRICPGKEDLKPSDNRRFSQINYFYKTVAVAKNGLGSEGTSFFSPPPQF